MRETRGREVGGRPLALPMVDIHTVGAGGGSIAGATPAARCASARARPAPTPAPPCYGRGGTEPTVTDANLVLGLLDAELAGGDRPRRRGRRARARRLGRRSASTLEARRGIVASPTPRWSARCA